MYIQGISIFHYDEQYFYQHPLNICDWRKKWQPTPVFLPGESQGWGSLVGCPLWGRIQSDMTKATKCKTLNRPHAHCLEKKMAPHSSILAWRIPWMEKPGGYSPWDTPERLNHHHYQRYMIISIKKLFRNVIAVIKHTCTLNSD